jgi:hypothetical protein
MSGAELFERHLDLRPLRGRRRGVVHCIFQPRDRTPSLSVDLDARVFHCFGCGVKGGARRFAELVGEERPASVGPKRWRSTLDEARHAVLADERAAQRRRDRFRPLMDASADFCSVMLNVDAARRVATAAGPDSELVWELLEITATLERIAHAELEAATA